MTQNGKGRIEVEVEALREILAALNIGHEALVECEGLIESSEAVLAEGWDDADRKMHEHEKKIIRSAIEDVGSILILARSIPTDDGAARAGGWALLDREGQVIGRRLTEQEATAAVGRGDAHSYAAPGWVEKARAETRDDAARAEADRRGAELYLGDSPSPTPAQIRAAGVYGYGFIHGAEWGRADERARIAARRDEVAEALDKVIDLPDSEEDWSQEMCDVYDAALDFGTGRMLARKVLVRDVTAAVLAALGVSEP